MDLLERINSLTDDQLRLIAERDDASGVLASYRLAELRGVPAPERSVVVMGDGYAIVAQDGKISRVATEGMAKIIRQEGGKFCVYSHDGSQAFGCYDTRDEAEERLRQIHYFAENTEKAIREGSFVAWNSSGGRARGQVEHVMTEGTLGVPGSSFSIDATEEDPAVLIRIWRPDSDGDYQATETLVGHRMSTLTRIDSLKTAFDKESFKPPQGVQEAAQRALEWISEGHAGSGFTDVGRARAAQLSRGDNVSEETIRRMAAYFSRHTPDKQAEGFKAGEDGFPSPGRVAWDAWGGDPGERWANSVVERLNAAEKQTCPVATTSPNVNLANQNVAREKAMYGPMDLENPGTYWEDLAEHWDLPIEETRKRLCGNCAAFDQTPEMLACIEEGTGQTEGIGFCRIFDFLCSQERTCSAWGEGGPIKELAKAQGFVRKADEKRFTLGPLYVPDFMDAHGEWTDADELQPAVWEWVKGGDRRIYLQHDREVEAGEWVEVMTMPQAWTVVMRDPDGTELGEVTYPPNTVFLGVQWNEEAWEMIKRGQLRGYSIGGFSDRVMADLPDKAARDGVEMQGSEEPVDLAKAIAAAVAEAMKTASPTVNVVMPEAKPVTRRVERDEHGNIARIVEEGI